MHASPAPSPSPNAPVRRRLSPGPWDPASCTDGEPVAALRIVTGLVHREVVLQRSVSVDLLGPGDLLTVAGEEEDLLGARVAYAALTEADVIVLSNSVLHRLDGRQDVVGQLVAQAAAQYRRMALHRAIAQLPRVEERLVAMLWLLAERWGRVGTDGVVVPLRLGHEVLGRLVGARRPTVSLALKHLAAAGTATRRPDGTWLLDPAGQPDPDATVGPSAPPAYLLDQPLEHHAGR